MAISDHSPVCLTHKLNTNNGYKDKHTTMYYRSYKYFNEPQFLYDLSCSGLNEILHYKDPDQCLDMFYEKFLKIVDMHQKT